MKRLLIVLACLFAFAAIAAVAARGSGGWQLTLTADPASTTPGTPVTVSGVLSTDDESQSVEARDVELYTYDNAQCTSTTSDRIDAVTVDDESAEWSTTSDGAYAYSVTSATPGTYWVQAVAYPSLESWDVLATSACTPVTFEVATPPTPPKPASSFLCWNRWMTDPVAYDDSVADQMWTTGNYYEPQALFGNVEGGTNIGAYHLVCNAPDTVKPTGEGLGGSGEVYPPNVMAAYHAAHPGGNDLNVYHIYK